MIGLSLPSILSVEEDKETYVTTGLIRKREVPSAILYFNYDYEVGHSTPLKMEAGTTEKSAKNFAEWAHSLTIEPNVKLDLLTSRYDIIHTFTESYPNLDEFLDLPATRWLRATLIVPEEAYESDEDEYGFEHRTLLVGYTATVEDDNGIQELTDLDIREGLVVDVEGEATVTISYPLHSKQGVYKYSSLEGTAVISNDSLVEVITLSNKSFGLITIPNSGFNIYKAYLLVGSTHEYPLHFYNSKYYGGEEGRATFWGYTNIMDAQLEAADVLGAWWKWQIKEEGIAPEVHLRFLWKNDMPKVVKESL